MNCTDWERLLDAYLDRELAGSLRLEFDAHRLACRRCQQTLSVMESCEHVIASDAPPALLSDDFTTRVMGQIGDRAPQTLRPWWRKRTYRLAAAVLPIAAALFLAIQQPWTSAPEQSERPLAADAMVTAVEPDPFEPGIDEVERHERGFALVTERIEQKLRSSLAAGKELSSETIRLAQYLNIGLPDDVGPPSVDFATVNPIGGVFFQMFAPLAPASDESEPAESETPEATRI